MRVSLDRRLSVVAGVTLAVLVAVGAPALAASTGPQVSIDSLNGSAVVEGAVADPQDGATLIVDGQSVSTPGPVVDAGSSPRVLVGEQASLVAVAAYGRAPYTFAWTSPAGGSRFTSATSASTGFTTTGLPAGDQVATVTITDVDGRTASDSVLVRVDELVTTTNATTVISADAHANGLPAQAIDVPFTVPGGATRVRVTLAYDDTTCTTPPEVGTVCAVDWDLKVSDPAGKHDADTAGATTNNPEVLDYTTQLAAGSWTAHAVPFTNAAGDSATVTIAVTAPTPGAFPVVSAGGPYAFTLGEPQKLTATVASGQAPVALAWDLDGDVVYERSGATATATYPLGTSFATVKATDAHGYEAKQIVPVTVAAAGATLDTTGVVVVAVADSGLNLYHQDFRATTYPDPKVLALTNNFTKHPSEYIPGYPATTPALNLTLGSSYYPASDHPVIEGIVDEKLYWVPGTKVIGVYDTTAGSGATAAPDTTHILDEDGHGTASTSVAAGNLYGFCPTCLIMFSEGLDETYNLAQPWIDISSNSFGAAANVGFAGLIPPSIPKERAEEGLLTLYAAGNGNENAFVTPEQTYINESLGPDWSIRVGAVERGTRKPVVGTGKPVDLSSFGSGSIPAAGRDSVGGTTNHSGTSAATPYTAGVFGTVLRGVRVALGDASVGQGRFSEPGAIAGGRAIASSPYLFDGRLTSAEIREAVLKTTEHDHGPDTAIYPTTTPDNEYQYVVEGYGIAEPASGARALDVLLGRAALPDRTPEDEFFATDTAIREEIWGTWDGGGTNSRLDPTAPEPGATTDPLEGATFGAAITSPADGRTLDPTQNAAVPVSGPVVFPAPGTSAPERIFFRRDDCGDSDEAGDADGERLETVDGPDGGDGCGLLASAATSKVFPTAFPLVSGALPIVLGAGSLTGDLTFASQSVEGVAAPDALSMKLEVTATVDGASVLLASQTVSGTITPPATTVTLHYDTPVAAPAAGKTATGLVATLTTETSTNGSYFVLDNPASFFDLPVVAPDVLASRTVELSVDDVSFAAPQPTALNGARTGFVGTLDVASLADGTHTLTVRARQGTQTSPPRTTTVNVQRSTAQVDGVALQIVPRGAEPSATRWVQAADTGGTGDYARYRGTLSMATLAAGSYDVVARLRIGDQDLSFARVAFERENGPTPVVPEMPFLPLVPIAGLLGGGAVLILRRRPNRRAA